MLPIDLLAYIRARSEGQREGCCCDGIRGCYSSWPCDRSSLIGHLNLVEMRCVIMEMKIESCIDREKE